MNDAEIAAAKIEEVALRTMPDGSGRTYDPGGYRPPHPYEPGNVAAIKSGSRSPRVHHRLGNFLVAGLLSERSDLESYPEAVSAWGRAEARVLLLQKLLNDQGLLDAAGDLRTSLLDRLNAAEARAERARALLGIDPRSEAALARDRAAASVLSVDLLAMAEKGRQALAARQGEAP